MKFNLLSQQNEGVKRLILIFSGWSTDAEYYSNICKDGWDVGVVTDYTDLSLDTSFLDEYETVWVFAWSLGVKAAAVSLPPNKIQNAIAINGTIEAVSDEYGIPVGIYDGTMNNLSSRSLNKFQLRMVGERDIYEKKFKADYSDEKIDILKRELEVLKNTDLKPNPLPWRAAYLSRNDKIFPYENMLRFWEQMDVEIISTDTPHCFNLQFVVSVAIPDLNLIAKKFTAASNTYVENASAQKRVAEKLASLIPFQKHRADIILELGPGKGVFTRMYSERIRPLMADFVDLVQLELFNVASYKEHYSQMDAEEFVSTTTNKYDYILSSSVVQWFNNLDAFMYNCHKLLVEGGYLCFSTYSKGNLKELDEFRPAPLHYYEPAEIEEIVTRYFNDVTVVSDEIKLEFISTRELLMHLKYTGVNGINKIGEISPFKLKDIRTLTYKPVYVIARRIKKPATK